MNFSTPKYLRALPSIALYGLGMQVAAAATDLTDGLYHIDFSAEDLNEIQQLLPNGGGMNPAFISDNTDPNIHLLSDAEVNVTFVDEGAGYKNSFGYFVYDDSENILYEQTIFANASERGGGGRLRPGDTVSLGTFDEGTNIGFWVQANGYRNPNGYTYYSLDQYNPDGLRHIAIINDVGSQRLVIGFEDLYNLGDQDYNDVVFTFTDIPFYAIDTSKIPTGSPEAGPVATALIGLTVFWLARGRRKRTRHAARQ
jgi:hypothetical protein